MPLIWADETPEERAARIKARRERNQEATERLVIRKGNTGDIVNAAGYGVAALLDPIAEARANKEADAASAEQFSKIAAALTGGSQSAPPPRPPRTTPQRQTAPARSPSITQTPQRPQSSVVDALTQPKQFPQSTGVSPVEPVPGGQAPSIGALQQLGQQQRNPQSPVSPQVARALTMSQAMPGGNLLAGLTQPRPKTPIDVGAMADPSAPQFGAPPQTQPLNAQPDVLAQPPAAQPGSMDWLNYANQAATRNQELSPELVEALKFLPEMGLGVEVFSGGQPAKGSGGARVGSTRHDNGNAADLYFTKGGERLNPATASPEDKILIAQALRRMKDNGLTGFGHGDGYMAPGSFHVGFGRAGQPEQLTMWGAGGRGANASPFLRQALASEAPAAPQAAASPFRDSWRERPQIQGENTAPVIQARNGGNSQRDALIQLLSDQNAPPSVRAMRGPVLQTLMQDAMRGNDPTAALKLQNMQLQNAKLQEDIRTSEAKRANEVRAEREAQAQQRSYAQDVTASIDDAERIMEGWLSGTGIEQWTLGFLPMPTDAGQLNDALDTIRANVGFNRLQEMREASPTGGALGQVSEMENRLLQATIAKMNPTQGKAALSKNLGRVRKRFFNVIHGEDNEIIDALGPEFASAVEAQTADLIAGGALEKDAFDQAMMNTYAQFAFGGR